MEKYKKVIRTMNLKYQLQHGIKNLNYLMDHILYQLFKILFSMYITRTWRKNYESFNINKTENRITFKIKTGYYLELLTPETMKLLGSTKSKITKNENGGNVPYLEVTEVVLIHCNVVNNSYQQKSRVLYTFVPNKSFGQLLNISPENFIFLKTFDSEFSYIEVWFTDQNSNLLEIEDKINIILVIN